MAEQIERDVAERDILLELRGSGDPPAELLGEDESVVPQPQGVLRDVGGCRGGGIRAGQLVTQPELVDGDVAVRVRRWMSLPRFLSLSRSLSLSKGHRCGTPSEAL